MIWLLRQGSGVCAKGRPGRAPARAAAVLLAVANMAWSAAASDIDPPPAQTEPVSLNQGITLDDATAVPRGAAQPTLTRELLADSPERETPPAALIPRRTVQRQSAPDAGSGAYVGPATPWYRTGLGGLVIVLAFIGLLYWAIRRWVPAARVGDSGIVRVVARTSLTPKQHVVLAQLGARLVLIGVSPDRMRTLCEIQDPDEVAELTARLGTPAARAARAFDEQLFDEAVRYREDWEPQVEPTPSARVRPGKRREPVKDLLNKLRVLQNR